MPLYPSTVEFTRQSPQKRICMVPANLEAERRWAVPGFGSLQDLGQARWQLAASGRIPKPSAKVNAARNEASAASALPQRRIQSPQYPVRISLIGALVVLPGKPECPRTQCRRLGVASSDHVGLAQVGKAQGVARDEAL